MKGNTVSAVLLLQKLTEGKYKNIFGRQVLQTAGLCLWAFAVSGAPAFLGVTPFGVALLCSVETALPLTAVSLCLGAAARGRVLLIPVYIILLFFRLTTALWLKEESRRVNTILSAVGMTVTGMIDVLTLPGGESLLRTAVGTITAVILVLCVGEYREGPLGKAAVIPAAVYTAACACAGISFYGINIGNALGFIICMNLARYSGGTLGCAAGALWGFGCAPEYAPAFAVSALIGAKVSSPLVGVGAGAVFCMMFASFLGGYHAIRDFLPDIAVGAAIYAPLSKLKFMKWDDLSVTEPPEDDPVADEKEKRLSAVAGALGSLSAIFYGMSDRMKESEGYDRATDMTGAFADDYSAMSELICSALEEEESAADPVLSGKIYGMLRMSRLKCSSVRVTGGRVKRITIRGLPKSVMAEPETLRARISNLCGSSFSPPSFSVSEKGVSAYLHAEPTFTARWSTASKPKPGERANGDCSTAFTAEDGRFYCILCDGMGSGREAAIASRTCCVFLQKMLEGCADPSLSVKMLNTFLRGKGYECFATVDIFCLDLYSGKAFFIKGGSAPSHLFRAGCEYTMASATAPVGIIREVYAEKLAFDALPGDRIVMKSDGAESEETPSPPTAQTADAAAKEILSSAISRGQNDDITVCVINIEGV